MKFLQWNEEKLSFKRERLLLLTESILCILLLISVCFNNNVWWDEASTYRMVTNDSYLKILLYTAGDVHPPLYYFGAKLAADIFGKQLFVEKMFSVSANVAMMILGMTKIYRRFGFKTTGMFLFLSCFAPQMAVHGVMIRMYSWASFFVLASAVFGYEALCDNRKSNWMLFVLFSLGGAYTLYFACIAISCVYLFMLLVILLKRRMLLRRFIYAVLATVAGYLPWLYMFFTVTLGGLNSYREDDPKAALGELFKSFWEWALGCGMKGDRLVYSGLILLAFLAGWLWKRNGESRLEAFFVTMLCFVPFYTIVMGKVMNDLAGRMLLNRYIEPALVLLWFGCCIGLSRYKNRLFYAAFACLLLLGIENYRFVYHDEYHVAPLIHETESFIENRMSPGDMVVYELEAYEVMYDYYMPEQNLVYYETLDLSQYEGKSFWYLDAWGGYFDTETVEKYQLTKEECGNFGIQSMDFKIYRITVNSDGK